MADEILNGALTDPTKNPYDPSVGHQAELPAMDPNDTLLDLTEAQRSAFIGHSLVESKQTNNELITENVPVVTAPEKPFQITSQELKVLAEAKKIIEKIQEMTSVGNIGVNLAGGASGDPKAIKLPGNTTTRPVKRLKKKVKTEKKEEVFTDFLTFLGKKS